MAEEKKVKKNYELKGEFVEKGEKKKFTKVVSAQNESFAKDKVFASLGSKHGAKRRFVKIEAVGEYREEK